MGRVREGESELDMYSTNKLIFSSKYIEVPGKVADVCVYEMYKDHTKNWPNFAHNEIEAALREFGYLYEDYLYHRYDTDRDVLLFRKHGIGFYHEWEDLRFRFKLADLFYRAMKWCYYNFRPK